MHLSAGFHRLADDVRQGRHGARLGNAAFCCHVTHGVYRAVPHDIVDVDFVADEYFFSGVSVDYAHQAVAFVSEEIEKRTVLPELVRIGRIIVGAIIVAEQQNQSFAHQLAQLATAFHVCLL